MNRPVLLGMNSPQSEDPDRALWPWNWASTGGRILKMLQEAGERRGVEFTPEMYVEGFERINVLDRWKWDAGLARAAAPLIHERVVGRAVVVCGLEVQRVMNYRRLPWLQWSPEGDEVRYVLIPHPSGLTYFYNSEDNRTRTGELLFSLWASWLSSQMAAAQSKGPRSPTAP